LLGGLVAMAVAVSGGSTAAEEPPAAVVVQFVRPDEQLDRLLALFEGAKAPHPAAALAAWRRATGRHDVLPKAQQATLAALNPGMVRELATLDGATLALGFDAEGRARWNLIVPRDDGTFAALATALALTDGAAEPPLGEAAVDRLGRGESALRMARLGETVVLAPGRDDLAAGLARLQHEAPDPSGDRPETGSLVHLNPTLLGRSGSPLVRGIAAGLAELGAGSIRGVIGLEGEALSVRLTTLNDSVVRPATLDPAWLDGIPASGVSAAF